jgi:hypothetical protein
MEHLLRGACRLSQNGRTILSPKTEIQNTLRNGTQVESVLCSDRQQPKTLLDRPVERRQPVLPLLGFCPVTYTLDQTSEEKGKLFLTSLATNSCVIGI